MFKLQSSDWQRANFKNEIFANRNKRRSIILNFCFNTEIRSKKLTLSLYHFFELYKIKKKPTLIMLFSKTQL